jgi:hypothetical protein
MDFRKSNGLIQPDGLVNVQEYPLFEDGPSKNTYRSEALKNIHEVSAVNDLFFSDLNVNTLQDGIRYLVYKRSGNNLVIGKQSDSELKVVMRSIYLQYAKNVPFKVLEQVKELNKMVLDYCVNNVMANVQQHIRFYTDIQSLPIPLEHSKSSSSAGLKTLHLEKF